MRRRPPETDSRAHTRPGPFKYGSLSAFAVVVCAVLVSHLALAGCALVQIVDVAQMTFPNTTVASNALLKGTGEHQKMGGGVGSYSDYHAHLVKVSDSIEPSSDARTEKRRAPLQKIENRFLKVATAQSARAALKRYTAEPHPAGTKGSFDFALRILREWGSLLGAPVPDSDEEITATRVFKAGTAESRLEMTRGCSDGGQQEVRPRVWIDTYETLVTDPIRASMSLSKAGSREAYWIADSTLR